MNRCGLGLLPRTAVLRRTIAPLGALQPLRAASSSLMRGQAIAMHILDPWVPQPVSLASFVTAEGRKQLKQRAKRVLTYATSMSMLRYQGVTLKAFKSEAELQYCRMNQAVASGDKELLERASTVSFATVLNPELKRVKRIGQGQWTLHGPLRVNVVNLCSARLQGDPQDKDKTVWLSQVTAKLTSKQSYALYDREGKLIGGDPEKEVDMTEYIVFERKAVDEDKLGWRVAGKIATVEKK
ncbi:hypothetical protein HDU98_008715 [Podochytrium sp. JEL0797]|nr:hypothetical protein HDU98_008715 [Podochytrium sp. JEL0797]